MKRILLLSVIFFAFSYQLSAQVIYGNEWIDYSKTYYKFKVGKTGIYRIPESLLVSYGLNNIPVQQFQLWHNGKEVALYTSNASGLMSSSDYIEFYGEQNDGSFDTQLYQNTASQLSAHYSLFTDSSAYYLTVNPAGNNLRYTVTANNTTNPPVPAETYFMYTVGNYPKSEVNPGYRQVVSGDYIYASTFDAGEGITSGDIAASSSYTVSFNNLYLYTSGPPAIIKAGLAGDAPNTRNINILLNNQSLLDTAMSQFNAKIFAINNIPLADFTANNTIGLKDESAISTDRMVTSFIELTYPRQFNFGNASQFLFQLAASAQPKYLDITNFNSSGVAPVLYDITDHLQLTGDISAPGEVKFLLPASLQPRTLFLVNESLTTNINTITSLEQRNFVDYSNASNQGNYLIITNEALLNDGNGNNYVQQYADYRSSATGGGYKANVALMNQLDDQFAYGIKNDPLAIRNFAQYAYNNFAIKPQYVFLIGKGVTYDQYRLNETIPTVEELQQVPTFGYPGSDNLLTAFGNGIVPQIPIGRLSAINGTEVGYYLDKVKQYENLQQDNAAGDQTVTKKGWQKNILNIVGASGSLATLLNFYFDNYNAIIEDTSYGGNPTAVGITTLDPVQQANGYVDSLFANGLGFVNYFGHSAANILGFNIDNPADLNNNGRYPIFMANGCNAGDIFILDSLRLQGPRAISESYVVSPNAGSVAFLASTYLGITDVLDTYITYFYKQISYQNYGGTLGASIKNTINNVVSNQTNNFLHYANAEEINLDGDPAIRTQYSSLPDYDIEPQYIQFNPSLISVSQGNFNLKVKIFNLGKYHAKDSLSVNIKRVLPNDTTITILNETLLAPAFEDSFNLSIPVNPITDAGTNKFIVTLDPQNKLNEITKSNNQAETDIYIYGNDIKPVYPYAFSIVNKPDFNFYGSTADMFAPNHTYNLEIDTTENFNSPLKVSQSISQIGGLVKFTPQIAFSNNQVYYWRLSATPTTGQEIWNNSSFLYNVNDSLGWNQSHYFQFLKDSYYNISLDNNRIYNYLSDNTKISIITFLYPVSGEETLTVGSSLVSSGGCGADLSSLQFIVLNANTLQVLNNRNVSGSSGLYGSLPLCSGTISTANEFNFQYSSLIYRKNAVNFLDSIPDNSIIILTNEASTTYLANTTFINTWKADSTQLGSGNTLYDKLKLLGFTQIDSFYHNIPFLFIFRKNQDGTFNPLYQAVGNTGSDQINYSFYQKSLLDSGYIKSPLIGPAKAWNGVHWSNHSLEQSVGDTSDLQVFGVDSSGNAKLLYDNTPNDTSLSFINAGIYPYLQLKLNSRDIVNYTPTQLDYWRVNYQPVPEGALAPNIYFSMPDTLDLGQPLQFSIAFANISPSAFDSMKVKIVLTDQNNIPHVIPINRLRKLMVNDTLHISDSIGTQAYPGLNTLYVEVNPDNDQPEQYHFNNFFYKQFFVKPDKFNPLLDVTFDGVHILNDDIVSARPHILVKLKDVSKYLALDDTSLMQVQVKYPDGSLHNYYFDNDTLRFTPANLNQSDNNTAQIDFYPHFTTDGTYQLVVTAKDKSGISAGTADYLVAFEVINKPMISNLLNYPNPFTTSTAFVFTITGSEIPSQFKIEIMTITGKVVKEITKDELGPLHIGTNITTYHWDGTDQYGQKLGNGVYLYRVVTSLNGNKMDLYKSGADKFITNGYGKMYLMR